MLMITEAPAAVVGASRHQTKVDGTCLQEGRTVACLRLTRDCRARIGRAGSRDGRRRSGAGCS